MPVFLLAIHVAVVLMTVWKRDFWPFTHYPMFSKARKPDQVRVIRFALIGPGDRRVWWKPEFDCYSEDIADRLHPDSSRVVFRAAAEVMRLVELEEPGATAYHGVEVVERVLQAGSTVERVVARVAKH